MRKPDHAWERTVHGSKKRPPWSECSSGQGTCWFKIVDLSKAGEIQFSFVQRGKRKENEPKPTAS